MDIPHRRWAKHLKFHGRVALTHLGVVERLGKHTAFPQRARAVRALGRASEVDARITLRPSMTRLDLDTAKEREMHAEFVASLEASDYVLAVRGEGNYSYRLYEALAAGRIPAYLDTGAVLPLELVVPWDDLCVIVPERETRHLGAVIASAHERMGSEGFARRQTAAAEAWEGWLSMEGYFAALHDRLSARVRSELPVEPAELAASLR